MLAGRDYVIPEDVKALAPAATAHRISLRPEMWVRQIHGDDVIDEPCCAASRPAQYPG